MALILYSLVRILIWLLRLKNEGEVEEYRTAFPVSLKHCSIKDSYLCGNIAESVALDFYKDWVSVDSWIVIADSDWDKPVKLPEKIGSHHKPILYCFKASKRGNDVYCSHVRKRLFNLRMACFDNSDLVFLDGRFDRSNLMFITLTYDTKLCNKISAYHNVGSELNLFLSNIKNNFGRIKLIRCFESFKESGYPHVHMIIEFLDCMFCFKQDIHKKGKNKGKRFYRVSNSLLDEFRKYWHSFIKIEGVRNMGGVGYILKYITKKMYQDNYNTVSHLWLYSKRSYSISHGFLEKTLLNFSYRLDTVMRNSKLVLKYPIFLGCFNVDFKPDCNFFVVKEPPPSFNWCISNEFLPAQFKEFFESFYLSRVKE